MEIMKDSAVRSVLAEYDQRMQSEGAIRKAVTRQEWFSRRDEFLPAYTDPRRHR
jgi:hypothetical protein